MTGIYRAAIGGVAAIAASLFACGGAQAKGLTVLYSFCAVKGCNYGPPGQPIVRDAAGNLFGVTGPTPSSGGVLFELRHERHGWTFHKLYDFCSACGTVPETPLIVDKNDNLYGIAGDNITQFNAQIFKLSPGSGGSGWTYSVLHKFRRNRNTTQGGLTYAGAAAGLPYDGISTLYGAAPIGGGTAHGTVFSLTPQAGAWNFATLHVFCKPSCRDGFGPFATLTMDDGGNLYGVTASGGKNNEGVVFKLAPDGDRWSETVLYDFCAQTNCTDGMIPVTNSVALDAAGNIYGTTADGGACTSQFCGVAYKLSPDGRETVIHDFGTELDDADGVYPTGGLAAGKSRFIGVTNQGGTGGNVYPYFNGSGTIFALNSRHKILYSFCSVTDCTDGAFPSGPLAADGKGHYYGVTQLGGAHGAGEIFEFTP
jgi:uncharacterized repeat protein (TIGR03803 family)